MKDTETRAQFIELRAQGNSYGKIAEALHISKSTCTAWEQELKQEIADRERERLQELYTLYGMHRESRIARIGDTLTRINAALDAKDLSELPAEKLLEYKLKYQRALREEYTDPVIPLQESSLETILTQYTATLEKSQSGELSPAQVKAQVSVIKEVLQTMRDIADRDCPLNVFSPFG